MIDRLAEMKAMVLDVSKRIKGDEFFIGLIQQLETSMNLICNDNETGENEIKGNDLITLEKNLNQLIGKLSQCSVGMYHFSELISLLQVKYRPDTKESTKNIENINKGIDRFDKNGLLSYDTLNNKNGE